jgi:hypothetical protein
MAIGTAWHRSTGGKELRGKARHAARGSEGPSPKARRSRNGSPRTPRYTRTLMTSDRTNQPMSLPARWMSSPSSSAVTTSRGSAPPAQTPMSTPSRSPGTQMSTRGQGATAITPPRQPRALAMLVARGRRARASEAVTRRRSAPFDGSIVLTETRRCHVRPTAKSADERVQVGVPESMRDLFVP